MRKNTNNGVTMKNNLVRLIGIVCLAFALANTSRAIFVGAHGHGVQTLDDVVDVSWVSLSSLYYPAVYGSDVWDYRDYLYGGNKVWIDFDTDYGALNTLITCGTFATGNPNDYVYLYLS